MNNKKMNQDTQKKHKFNIVDFVVVLIAFIVACVAFLWFDPFDWIQDKIAIEEKTLICVFELEGIDKSDGKTIKKDDSIVFVADGIDVGRVLEINNRQYSEWVLPEGENQMVLVKDPTKDTVYVTVELLCDYKDEIGYFLHDYQLLVGKDIEMRFPMFSSFGRCVSIKVSE